MKGDFINHDPDPVTNVEISGKHIKLKIIVVVVATVIALVFFGMGIVNCMSESKGWKTLGFQTDLGNCSGDFVCYYYLDQDGRSGKDLLNDVNNDYAEACIGAYRIFNADEEFGSLNNLATLNRNINTEITVNSVLYSALQAMVESGGRSLYLAPVYSYYYKLYFSDDELSAAENDPAKNDELAEKFGEILHFTNSDEHINLQFLGDDKVKLCVSSEYSAYAEAESFYYLDFFNYKNAFIIDYIADFMSGRGHGGIISGFDGCMRSFLSDTQTYTLNVFDLDDNFSNVAATLTGNGKISSVRFRDYDTSAAQYDYFYTYSDGITVTPYLTDKGLNCSCMHDFLAYSYTETCAYVMLKAQPVFASEVFDDAKLSDLKNRSVFSVYCSENEVLYNDPLAQEGLQPLITDEYSYTKKFVG